MSSVKPLFKPSEPVRLITVGAFYDRLGDKHAQLLSLSAQQEKVEEFALKAVMQRIDRSEFIDLDDERLRIGLQQTGVFSEPELDAVFADGTAKEVPEVLKLRGV